MQFWSPFDNWYVQIKLRLDMCSDSALDLSPVWSVLTQPRQGNICLFGRNFMSTFYPPEPRLVPKYHDQKQTKEIVRWPPIIAR